MENKRETGTIAEEAVCREYIQKGYEIVARNFRFKRLGEIDIIALSPALQKGGERVLCFCEVKYRSGTFYGSPEEAVDIKKQTRIRKLASAFIMLHPEYSDLNIRFDVASVSGDISDCKIHMLYGAF